MSLNHIRIQCSNGSFNIQVINNYLVYHNFVNFTKESGKDKEKILFKYIFETNRLIKSKNMVDKSAVPLLAV